MNETPRGRLLAYGLALLTPVVAMLVRLPLGTVLGDRLLYMSFFPAVVIVAYIGGFWPGILTTIVSVLIATFFLVEPLHTLKIVHAYDAVALGILMMCGMIVSVMSESLHRTRRRLLANERQRVSEVLRETEDRFRQLAENIHEIFWMKDALGERVLYVSPGYEEIWGRTCQSLYGATALLDRECPPGRPNRGDRKHETAAGRRVRRPGVPNCSLRRVGSLDP